MRTFLIWFGATNIIGTSIAVLLASSTNVGLGTMLFIALTAAYLIGGATTLVGRKLVALALIRQVDTSRPAFWVLMTGATALAGVTATVLSFAVYWLALPDQLFTLLIDRAVVFFVVTLLINSAAAPTFTFIDLKTRAVPPQADQPTTKLQVRHQGRERAVELAQLVYVSAAGRKTIIHTTGEDLELSARISDIARQLPDHFVRTHRSYLVNRHFIRDLRHESGGQYLLTLADEDDTVIPVSRQRVEAVRSAMDS